MREVSYVLCGDVAHDVLSVVDNRDAAESFVVHHDQRLFERCIGATEMLVMKKPTAGYLDLLDGYYGLVT
jgi:hypothetical protein